MNNSTVCASIGQRAAIWVLLIKQRQTTEWESGACYINAYVDNYQRVVTDTPTVLGAAQYTLSPLTP